jgi:glucosamine-6-phosphate deaminase
VEESEEELQQMGVDLMLLASGSGDGHVAFNAPGTPFDSWTRIVELPESTRRDNLATYPHFADLKAVPRTAVTLGISSIVNASRDCIMVAAGPVKKPALNHLSALDSYQSSWPATVVAACRGGRLYTDAATTAGS